jgi:hypothetical protein
LRRKGLDAPDLVTEEVPVLSAPEELSGELEKKIGLKLLAGTSWKAM